MAVYTPRTSLNAAMQPDKPIKASTHRAATENIEALAEGSASAPRIQPAAMAPPEGASPVENVGSMSLSHAAGDQAFKSQSFTCRRSGEYYIYASVSSPGDVNTTPNTAICKINGTEIFRAESFTSGSNAQANVSIAVGDVVTLESRNPDGGSGYLAIFRSNSFNVHFS